MEADLFRAEAVEVPVTQAGKVLGEESLVHIRAGLYYFLWVRPHTVLSVKEMTLNAKRENRDPKQWQKH